MKPTTLEWRTVNNPKYELFKTKGFPYEYEVWHSVMGEPMVKIYYGPKMTIGWKCKTVERGKVVCEGFHEKVLRDPPDKGRGNGYNTY